MFKILNDLIDISEKLKDIKYIVAKKDIFGEMLYVYIKDIILDDYYIPKYKYKGYYISFTQNALNADIFNKEDAEAIREILREADNDITWSVLQYDHLLDRFKIPCDKLKIEPVSDKRYYLFFYNMEYDKIQMILGGFKKFNKYHIETANKFNKDSLKLFSEQECENIIENYENPNNLYRIIKIDSNICSENDIFYSTFNIFYNNNGNITYLNKFNNIYDFKLTFDSNEAEEFHLKDAITTSLKLNRIFKNNERSWEFKQVKYIKCIHI